MTRKVDVVIIGAGTAGLNALSQVNRAKKSFVLVNGGELGTTCARVGCMPSKAMIHIANDYYRRKEFSFIGISGEEHLRLDNKYALEHIRSLRDYFVSFVLKDIKKLEDNYLEGYAKFKDRNHVLVDDEVIEFDKAIIATGTQPIIPKEWEQYRDKLITTDEIFELKELPDSIAVIGLGAIGLELGQALHRMNVKVSAFSRSKTLGNIKDNVVNKYANDIFGDEFNINLGQEVSIISDGNNLRIQTNSKSVRVERALISIGRKPNIGGLKLQNLNIDIDKNGMPRFDKNTMQVEDTNIFIAGDVNKQLTILHEASDEGKIAGYNASAEKIIAFKRRTSLSIVFTEPNIIQVGKTWDTISDNKEFVFGEAEFENTGRPLIMGQDKGVLRIYANKKSGKIVGAAMIGPRGENLAHLIASAVSKDMTVLEMLNLPFYHPVIEEFIQSALKNVLNKIDVNDVPILGLEVAD